MQQDYIFDNNTDSRSSGSRSSSRSRLSRRSLLTRKLYFFCCGYYIRDLNCMFHKLNRVTYRWSWGSLHSCKSSVSLHASLTSLTSLTLVSTSSSGSLNKDITCQTTVLCIPRTEWVLWFESLTRDLQRVHGDQQGQQHRQDQQGPKKEKK